MLYLLRGHSEEVFVVFAFRKETLAFRGEEGVGEIAFHALDAPATKELLLSSGSTLSDDCVILKVLSIYLVQNSLAFFLRHLLLQLCLCMRKYTTSFYSILPKVYHVLLYTPYYYIRTHHD